MYRTIYFLNLLQIANFKLHPKKSHNTLLTYKRFSQNSTTIFFFIISGSPNIKESCTRQMGQIEWIQVAYFGSRFCLKLDYVTFYYLNDPSIKNTQNTQKTFYDKVWCYSGQNLIDAPCEFLG